MRTLCSELVVFNFNVMKFTHIFNITLLENKKTHRHISRIFSKLIQSLLPNFSSASQYDSIGANMILLEERHKKFFATDVTDWEQPLPATSVSKLDLF